jgi:hypothetical protein
VPSTFFDTMPSAPSRQACAKTTEPSSAMCSLNRIVAQQPPQTKTPSGAALNSTTDSDLRWGYHHDRAVLRVRGPMRSTITAHRGSAGTIGVEDVEHQGPSVLKEPALWPTSGKPTGRGVLSSMRSGDRQ